MKKRVLIILGLIVAGFLGFLAVGLILVGRPYKNMSSSMLPIIEVDEIVFCAQDEARPLTYGDVVTYTHPHPRAEGAVYLKMVVGLAGDTIQMRDGVLWINNNPVPRRKVVDFEISGGYGEKTVRRYEETLPGGAKTFVLDILPASSLDNTPPIVVPADHIFVIGNNRDYSTDSRMVSAHGPVPKKNVICKIELNEV